MPLLIINVTACSESLKATECADLKTLERVENNSKNCGVVKLFTVTCLLQTTRAESALYCLSVCFVLAVVVCFSRLLSNLSSVIFSSDFRRMVDFLLERLTML